MSMLTELVTTEPKPYKTEATAKLEALTELQAEYHGAVAQIEENKPILADAIAAEQAALHATDIDLEEQIERIIRTEAKRKALESRAAVKNTGVDEALKRLAEETMRTQSWVDGVANHETLAAMELIKLNIAKELEMNPGKLSTADLSLIRKSPVVLKWQGLTLTSHLAQNHEVMAGRFPEGPILSHAKQTVERLTQLLELVQAEH